MVILSLLQRFWYIAVLLVFGIIIIVRKLR